MRLPISQADLAKMNAKYGQEVVTKQISGFEAWAEKQEGFNWPQDSQGAAALAWSTLKKAEARGWIGSKSRAVDTSTKAGYDAYGAWRFELLAWQLESIGNADPKDHAKELAAKLREGCAKFPALASQLSAEADRYDPPKDDSDTGDLDF